MSLTLAIAAGFLLAPAAPVLHRLIGDRSGYLVALLPVGLVAFFAQFIGEFSGGDAQTFVYDWIPSLGLRFSLRLDGLALFFALLITSVGGLVAVYTSGYLQGNPLMGIFFAFMLCFMASMLGLALAGNLILLYVFWELTTLTSFLLIGFKHEKGTARDAAVKSFLVTSLGGLAMLAGFVLLGQAAGTYEIAELLKQGEAIRGHRYYPAILVLIALGAFTKSAQFPFYFWLPAAMEAPTPVSAYLHSATMVKAGVYLLARMLPILGGTDLWLGLLTAAGAATMLIGAWLAFFDSDLKGILAYLTVNVLGTLVMLLGIGSEEAVKAAMVYMLAHALYKGALFLLAGAVDHETGTRNLSELRGLVRVMPLTAALAMFSALSMAGVAPLLGFTAKEEFLTAVWHARPLGGWLTVVSVLASLLLVGGAGLAGFHPFWGKKSSVAEKAHEPCFRLWISPLLLTVASLLVGFLPQKFATPLLEPAVGAIQQHMVPMKLKLWHGWTVPLGLSLLALVGGVVLFGLRETIWQKITTRGLAENWGPEAAYRRTMQAMNWVASQQTRILQNGSLRIYVITTIATMIALVSAAFWRMDLAWQFTQERDVRFHELAAAAFILIATIVAVLSRSRFLSITALGVVGLNIAWLFNSFNAPDLAMTQLVVESLIVLVFVLAFYRLPKYSLRSNRRTRLRDAVLAIGTGTLVAILLFVVTQRHSVGRISDYYVRESVPQGYGRNVVNVILVDFRALDTLGEITVVATAAIGVVALTKLVLSRGRTP